MMFGIGKKWASKGGGRLFLSKAKNNAQLPKELFRMAESMSSNASRDRLHHMIVMLSPNSGADRRCKEVRQYERVSKA